MQSSLINQIKETISKGRFDYSKDAHKDVLTHNLSLDEIKEIMIKGNHFEIREIYSEEEVKQKIKDISFINESRYLCYYVLYRRDRVICYSYHSAKNWVHIIHMGYPTKRHLIRIRQIIQKKIL